MPDGSLVFGVGARAGIGAALCRRFAREGLHVLPVAHVVIDGVIDGDQVNQRFPAFKDRLGEDGMLQVDAIADAYWALHSQQRSAWTLELDLRPFKEHF